MARPGMANDNDPKWLGLAYVVGVILIALVGLLYFVPKYSCDPICPAEEERQERFYEEQ